MKGYSFAELAKLAEAAVPKSRKVNGKALTSDITLTRVDVGAAPTGYGLGEPSPGNLGGQSLDTLRYNGWRSYNRDAGDSGAPYSYGTCLDIGHADTAATFPGWAGQLFLDSVGRLYTRVNASAGSMAGSQWGQVFTTQFPPTPNQVGAVKRGQVPNGGNLDTYYGEENVGLWGVLGGDTVSWPWNNSSPGALLVEGTGGYTKQQAWRGDTFDTLLRIRNNATGVWSKWVSVYNSEYFPRRTNWANFGETRHIVTGGIVWANYDGGHVIIDASKGNSPEGDTISNTDAKHVWAPSFPTLVGWNGVDTYGVRVDSARTADSAANATNAQYAVSATTAASAPNYLPLIGGMLARNVGARPSYSECQLVIDSVDGAGAAGIGFHRPGREAHSLQLRDDFAGLTVLTAQGGLGRLRVGELTANAVTDSGHRVFSPVNPPSAATVGLGNVENKRWVLRGSGACNLGLTNGLRDYRGRIDTGVVTDGRIFDPSRYRVVLKTLGSVSTSGDPNAVWWNATGEVMAVTYWSQPAKVMIEVFTSGANIGSGVVDTWELWEWA